MAEINQKHKDRLFCMIFKIKENALSLYNALNHTHYTDINELEITTIDDVIYLHLKNDVSFIISDYMNLLEHQSTYNGNMALRSFIYFGKMYSSYIEKNEFNIYGSKKVKIPTPKSIVIYNGDSKRKEVEVLKLSEHFIHSDEIKGYEWTTIVYNINEGYNQELLNQCKPLYEYSYFVNQIKENKRKGHDNKEAIDLAVKICIKNNVMASFLRKHRAEVLDVCLTEYDEMKHLQHVYEEGIEEGIEKGIEQGIEQDKQNVIIALYKEGDALDKISKVVQKSVDEIQSILKKNDILKEEN